MTAIRLLLKDEQLVKLREESAKTGASVNWIIRQAIDQALEKGRKP